MSLINESCAQFTDALASKEPVPGGGGASALVGAIGTALGHMVGALTTGKKKYEPVEAEITAMMKEARGLQKDLLALVQKDAEVFAPLAKAYGMPKETEEERAQKAKVMESVLKDACSVPMEIMETCCRAIGLCAGFAEKGSKLAISDAAAGAVVCKAALQGASLNVYINTKAMADRSYAAETNRRADRMLEQYTAMADAVLGTVMGQLK